MKLKIKKEIIVLSVCFVPMLTARLWAQQSKLIPHPGKVFISKTMADLEIVNDSTLSTSIQNDNEISLYKIKNDTLFVNELASHGYKKSNEYFEYLILKANSDTVILKRLNSNDTPTRPENALFFVSLKRLKRPLINFRSIRLSFSNPFSGAGASITVDSTGKVSYITYPEINQNGRNLSLTTGYLSQNEYATFLDLLSESMVTDLPENRGCDIDGGSNLFEISIANKTFKTIGCRLYYPQRLLFSYLYGLDKNKGVEGRHKGE